MKKIVKGSVVRLRGFRGWYEVTYVQGGGGLICVRGKGPKREQVWTDLEEVAAVLNKRTKRTMT